MDDVKDLCKATIPNFLKQDLIPAPIITVRKENEYDLTISQTETRKMMSKIQATTRWEQSTLPNLARLLKVMSKMWSQNL